VKEIRVMLANGTSQDQIAKKYGLHQTTIHYIKAGKHWGDV
jgi:transposase